MQMTLKFLFEKYIRGQHRPYQPPNEPAVRKAFENVKGRLFIDIGANAGYYTLRLADRFEKIYAVEQDFQTAQELAKRIEKAGLKNKVNIFAYRLCDENTTAFSRTFDSLFYGETVELVKMDIEGDEFKALRGMKDALGNGRIKAIMIELHDKTRENELIQLLEAYSFHVDRIDLHPRYMAKLEY
jgi:Methyltransferase FkbM domain